ncbi:alpha/beta fold hydrolase [Paenibacillus sp. YN15]|uniref:alpha/beta fold hydrolase n=1 Tax=Paenibacillus sp. YN15 TaxID=1742774 RepID=UPI000DCECFCF|nr:alpha/beta hydrolase [Paenibacillus sp. YN15]RAV04597.1 alpha/beta hydrolase [Paenibacillus sp. YN15]
MRINIDGIDIEYTDSGSGRVVLLLHGWGANKESFSFIAESLGKHFRVVAPDFPGFGGSGEPPVPWGSEEYCAFVEKFNAALGIENPIVAGHSHGGRTAIRFASRNPVHKLILLDSAGIKPKRKSSYYIRVYAYKAAKHLLKLPGLRRRREQILERFRKSSGSEDYKRATPLMRQTLVKLVNEDLKAFLPKIQAPTLLLWGELDTDTPLDHGKIMEKLIPNAGLVTMKGAGHWAFAQRPRETVIILNNFLESDKDN